MGNVVAVVAVVGGVGYVAVAYALVYATASRTNPYYGGLFPPSFGDKGQRTGAGGSVSVTSACFAAAVQPGRRVSFRNLPL